MNPQSAPQMVTRGKSREATRPMTRDSELVTVSFQCRRGELPALRSAVGEMRNVLGTRLEGSHRFAREFALTRATIAFGALGAAVNRLAPKEDPDYAR